VNGTPAIDRIAISLSEARLDHGLSQRQLAALSGVSRPTIAKAERGGRVHPALLVRLAATLVVLDVYRPGPDFAAPEPKLDDELAVRMPLRHPEPSLLAPWAA
jgi:transcriptional regulator with XRE-family HTH domain